MTKDCLPEHLKDELHWDWPWPFSKIPRAWTAFCWGVPVKVCGPQTETRKDKLTGQLGPAPIGEPGSWHIARFPHGPWWLAWMPIYYSVRFKSGRHFRIGARWDDVDSYIQFPTLAIRKYPVEGDRDTSTG